MAPALRCPAPGPMLGARPHAALANPRRSAVLVRAKVEEYVAPSSRTGATELNALERYTEASHPKTPTPGMPAGPQPCAVAVA